MLALSLAALPAHGKAELLQPGTKIVGVHINDHGDPESWTGILPDPMYLLERGDIDRCNFWERQHILCDESLVKCQKEAEAAAGAEVDPDYLHELGWGGVIVGAAIVGAAAFAGGMVLGIHVNGR